MSRIGQESQDQNSLPLQHKHGIPFCETRDDETSPGDGLEPITLSFEPLEFEFDEHERLSSPSVHSPSHSEYRTSLNIHDSRMNKAEHQNIDDSNEWHPFFLRKNTIYGWIAMFTFMIVALETIFAVSENLHGLAHSNSGLHYLWTYGPTAIVTGIAALWACVDYLAKVAAPWTRAVDNEAAAKESLLLDYVSPLALFVPFQAMKKRDILVSTTAVVSLILTVITILSASLIRLTVVEIKVPMRLQTKFVDDSSRLRGPGLLPLYEAIGLERYNMSYPDAVSPQFVYQSVSPSSEGILGLNATVEGLSVGLDCEPANLVAELQSYNGSRSAVNVPVILSLTAPECDFTLTSQPYLKSQSFPSTNTSIWTSGYGRVVTGYCGRNSSNLSSYRLAWILANTLMSKTAATDIVEVSFQNSQQIICKPSYNISDINILRGEDNINHMSFAENPRPRLLANVHAWNMASSMVEAYSEDHGTTMSGIINTIISEELDSSWTTNDLDNLSIVIQGLTPVVYPDFTSSVNQTTMISSLQWYYATHSLFLIHDALMEPTSEHAVGYAVARQNRLMVQTLTCQLLVGLCILSILGLIVAIAVSPRHFSLSGNPGTIMGLMVLTKPFAHKFPRGLGASSSPILKDGVHNWTNSQRVAVSSTPSQINTNVDYSTNAGRNSAGLEVPISDSYRPFALRTYPRMLVCVFVVGIIFALEMLLQKSKRDNGLGIIQSEKYLLYLWTTLPTIVLSAIGMFFTSLDSGIRDLAPLQSLRKGPTSSDRSIELNLRGLIAPHALFRELRLGHFSAGAATATAILASLLTITSGSIFFETDVPSESVGQLRLSGSFSSTMYNHTYDVIFGAHSGTGMGVNDLGIISTLILGNNLSYPKFTFESFTFPELALENNTAHPLQLDTPNTPEIEIHAVVPVLSGGLTCYQHPQADISVDFLHVGQDDNLTVYRNTPWPAGNTIRVNITGEFCAKPRWDTSPQLSVTALYHLDDPSSSNGVFGATWANVNNIRLYPCSNYVYVWGNFSHSANDKAPAISAMALSCNASIYAIDVDVAFLGYDLVVNQNSPPIPREETMRAVISASDSKLQFDHSVYQDLYPSSANNNTLLDAFFSLLTTSQYAIPLSALSDPAQNESVLDSIKLHHSIIMAQTLSSTARVSVSDGHAKDPGVFDRLGKGTVNTTTYPANITNLRDIQRRVIQDPTSTRIVQSLLFATLFFALLSWGLALHMGVLPRPSTNIASVLALLVDGNIYTENNANTSDLDATSAKTAAVFGEKARFRLGIGRLYSEEDEDSKKRSDNERFAIWVSEPN